MGLRYSRESSEKDDGAGGPADEYRSFGAEDWLRLMAKRDGMESRLQAHDRPKVSSSKTPLYFLLGMYAGTVNRRLKQTGQGNV